MSLWNSNPFTFVKDNLGIAKQIDKSYSESKNQINKSTNDLKTQINKSNKELQNKLSR